MVWSQLFFRLRFTNEDDIINDTYHFRKMKYKYRDNVIENGAMERKFRLPMNLCHIQYGIRR